MTNKSKIKKMLKYLTKHFNKKQKIVPIIRLSGVITEGSILSKGLSFEGIEESIDKAFSFKKAKAVAIQVNSPGGSPVQSELIAAHIIRLSKEKNIPVYTFAEDVAASGGYWLLCSGDELYGSPSSIIGSIGVITSGFGYVDAIKKIGVERRVYTQGENKSILDPFSKVKKEDIAFVQGLQKDVHDIFKDYVRSRRGKNIKKKDEAKLFSGEFYNGIRAKEHGLIDGIGSMHDIMREKFGKNVKFIKVNKPKGWLKRKFGASLHADKQSIANDVAETLIEKSYWQKFGL